MTDLPVVWFPSRPRVWTPIGGPIFEPLTAAIVEAHRFLESNEQFGEIVVTV